MAGSPQAIPNVFTARLLALRTLKDKFPSIVDVIEPGGSGDMYRGLNPEECDTLREVTGLGFPPQGWFNSKTIAGELGVAFTTAQRAVELQERMEIAKLTTEAEREPDYYA